MEDQFLNEILKTTYTLESFKKRVLALKLRVEKRVFQSDSGVVDDGQTEALVSQETVSQSQEWANGFNSELLSQVTSGNFRDIFDAMDEFISGSTPLTIYFVFLPDDGEVKEMGEWLRKSLGNQKLIFSVKINTSLIGGCAIAYNGVYKDYSLKAKISANKEKLVEEFRRYLKQ